MRVIKFPGWQIGIREPGDTPMDVPTLDELAILETAKREAVTWAIESKEKESAAAADSTVHGLINDMQALRDAIKASTGSLALSKAQQLTMARAVLYALKQDKSAISAVAGKE